MTESERMMKLRHLLTLSAGTWPEAGYEGMEVAAAAPATKGREAAFTLSQDNGALITGTFQEIECYLVGTLKGYGMALAAAERKLAELSKASWDRKR